MLKHLLSFALLCLLPLAWLGCSEQKEADTSALTRPLPSEIGRAHV